MGKEYQHIIPQVYLKQFGYQLPERGNKWFVSASAKGSKSWKHHQINRLFGEYDLYDLDEAYTVSNKIIEKSLHGGIENRLPLLVTQLEKGDLDENIQLAVAETTANFFCRNKRVREWLGSWIDKDHFKDFFIMITKYITPKEDVELIFDQIKNYSEKDRINILMVLYMNYVSILLRNCSINVYHYTEEPVFTSDNPVCLEGVDGYGLLEKEEMNIYFPISPSLIVHFYWHPVDESKEQQLIIDSLEFHETFHHSILFDHVARYLVAPLEKSKLGH